MLVVFRQCYDSNSRIINCSWPDQATSHMLIKNPVIDDKPSSLPRYRRRKGNIRGPAQRGLDISQKPAQQPKCLLLNRLPPELRLSLWEVVLGGLKLHIIQRSPKRLGCVICPQEDHCDICRGVLQQPVKSAETCSNVNLLSLLVTCKQM